MRWPWFGSDGLRSSLSKTSFLAAPLIAVVATILGMWVALEVRRRHSFTVEYVVRVRIQAAIFALRETRDKVSTIAWRFGFYDGPHLALTLRRRGLGRPGDFRRP